MRISMFNSNEEYAKYMDSMADAVEANGLRLAKENLERALSGQDKDVWLRANGIKPDSDLADKIWQEHIEWLAGDVTYLERKVKRYRNKARKARLAGD